MITLYKTADQREVKGKYFKSNEPGVELRGLSTDNKPTDVPNGSIFIEMNTGKILIFDEDNLTWREL